MQTISVIGAGTMGRGIAQAAVLSGYEVFLCDINTDVLGAAQVSIFDSIDKGVARGKPDPDAAARAHKSLALTTSLVDAATADLVIEAAPEQAAVKERVFATLDSAASPSTILATNTSSLSVSVLAGAHSRPDRFIGLHFFNPVHIMPLVEVIRGDLTSDATLHTCREFVERLGKTAVIFRDSPAFIVDRVPRPCYGEAFRLLSENAARVEEIDRLMTSIGFRMGPFELIDLIGGDVNFAVTQSVYEAFFQDPKYRPHPIQQRMVASGRLGRKTGRGYYTY